jgi:hypothetical protein
MEAYLMEAFLMEAFRRCLIRNRNCLREHLSLARLFGGVSVTHLLCAIHCVQCCLCIVNVQLRNILKSRNLKILL